MNAQQIKEQYTCLDYLGKPIRKTSSGWYLYRCPWKEDNHPSLNVSPDGRVWHDQSTGEKGGIIELVMTSLNTKDLSRVCAEFNSFSFSLPKTLNSKKEEDIECSVFKSYEVVPLRSRGLFAYLYHRKVNIEIAKQFLMEAHYSFKDGDSYLYALAYANDKGGYELRGAPYRGNPEGYKGCTSPKGITTHLIKDNAPMVVFEGFMDMLSWVTLTDGVKHNLVVMNSVVNKEATVELLQSISDKVYLCLDNDKGGDEATAFIKNVLPSVIDYRSHYADCKDVNEYLIKKS